MLTRRTFLGAGAALPLLAGGSIARPKRPNILLIMADDLGREIFSTYGSESFRTPNIDRMAETGVKLTNCYGTARCGPSRVELLTGLYPFRTGWRENMDKRPVGQQFLDPSFPSLARTLRDIGYSTVAAGKWQLAKFQEHPNHPEDLGFDEYCLNSWFAPYSGYDDQSFNLNGDMTTLPGNYSPDIAVDWAFEFIRRASGPWFVYLPMLLGHRPFAPTPLSPTTEFPADDPRYFPDMVTYLDLIVGRIVRRLRRWGMAESTVVIFTSDNGTTSVIKSRFLGRTITGGKSRHHDLGIRMPCIVNWPGTLAPLVSDDLVDFSDFHPTLARLAGTSVADTDGRSFVNHLFGRSGRRRRWIYVENEDRRLVRTRRWKLKNDGRLYDMLKDPWERRPTTSNDDTPKSAEIRDKLQQTLDGLAV